GRTLQFALTQPIPGNRRWAAVRMRLVKPTASTWHPPPRTGRPDFQCTVRRRARKRLPRFFWLPAPAAARLVPQPETVRTTPCPLRRPADAQAGQTPGV